MAMLFFHKHRKAGFGLRGGKAINSAPLINIFSLFILILFAGCQPQTGDHHGFSPLAEPVMNRLPTEPSIDPAAGLTSEHYLLGVKRVEMKGVGGALGKFEVKERIPEMTQYPCQECHVQSLSVMRANSTDQQSHWDIQLQHANAPVMQCETCHVSDEMNFLHTLTGQKISFNHAYQVCAQCHSDQAKDWIGGAHGKRVGGWAPPRVVYNCSECHNPHRPQLEKRWPSRASSLPAH